MKTFQKDPVVYLVDMLLEIHKIETFVKTGSQDDQMTNYALMRAFTVMGEAAKRIPEEIRQKSPSIPWQKIVGIRNVLSHDYEDIRIGMLWNIVKQDIPTLKADLVNLYKKLTGKDYAY